MSKRAAHVKTKELKTDVAIVKDLEVSIGRIFEETWTEPARALRRKQRKNQKCCS